MDDLKIRKLDGNALTGSVSTATEKSIPCNGQMYLLNSGVSIFQKKGKDKNTLNSQKHGLGFSSYNLQLKPLKSLKNSFSRKC